MDHHELNRLMRTMGFEDSVTALIDADKARAALQHAYDAGAHAASTTRCDFDECEDAATHERGCMSYCRQHAHEHDDLVRQTREAHNG